MSHAWAVVLGLVQGIAEFLPISSSAHLTLIPWAFRIADPALSSLQFDIALHAGSFLAIVVALWREWTDLARRAWRRDTDALRFVGFLLVTSVPGALFGVLFEDQAATVFRTPLLVGLSLIAFGGVLWTVDRFMDADDGIETMSWLRAGLVGLAQALAIVPGVSRAGATITAGRALGLSRDAIARYSFMAAAPIIGGAAVFGLRDVPLASFLSLDWVLGFLTAAVSSVVAMRFMLSFVRKRSYAPFAYYRFALGAAVVLLALVRG